MWEFYRCKCFCVILLQQLVLVGLVQQLQERDFNKTDQLLKRTFAGETLLSHSALFPVTLQSTSTFLQAAAHRVVLSDHYIEPLAL